MNISIIGAGYVGLTLAIILSTKYEVKLLEIKQGFDTYDLLKKMRFDLMY